MCLQLQSTKLVTKHQTRQGGIMNIQTGEQGRQITAEDFQSPAGDVNTKSTGPQFTSIQTINESVQRASTWVRPLEQEIGRVIVGQNVLIERLLVGILSNGHILLEGVPGLAKTLALNTLASAIQTSFRRIQFTPDMLPADIVGTEIYNPGDVSFVVKQGPVFANLILADEINRAPAKVQSALLQAMQERQVTIGEKTYDLPDPFLVLATQNPSNRRGLSPAGSPGGSVYAQGGDLLSFHHRGTDYPGFGGRLRSRTKSQPVVQVDDIISRDTWSTPSTWMTRSRTILSTSFTPQENRKTTALIWSPTFRTAHLPGPPSA